MTSLAYYRANIDRYIDEEYGLANRPLTFITECKNLIEICWGKPIEEIQNTLPPAEQITILFHIVNRLKGERFDQYLGITFLVHLETKLSENNIELNITTNFTPLSLAFDIILKLLTEKPKSYLDKVSSRNYVNAVMESEQEVKNTESSETVQDSADNKVENGTTEVPANEKFACFSCFTFGHLAFKCEKRPKPRLHDGALDFCRICNVASHSTARCRRFPILQLQQETYLFKLQLQENTRRNCVPPALKGSEFLRFYSDTKTQAEKLSTEK